MLEADIDSLLLRPFCGYIPAFMLSHCYCIELRTAARKTSAIYDEALAPLGINIAQYSLLRKIEYARQLSLTELAKLCELDRSTIGRNVKVLERMALVKATTGKDQREATLELTDQGKRRLAESVPVWRIAQAKIEAMLGGSDAASQLHGLLQSF